MPGQQKTNENTDQAKGPARVLKPRLWVPNHASCSAKHRTGPTAAEKGLGMRGDCAKTERGHGGRGTGGYTATQKVGLIVNWMAGASVGDGDGDGLGGRVPRERGLRRGRGKGRGRGTRQSGSQGARAKGGGTHHPPSPPCHGLLLMIPWMTSGAGEGPVGRAMGGGKVPGESSPAQPWALQSQAPIQGGCRDWALARACCGHGHRAAQVQAWGQRLVSGPAGRGGGEVGAWIHRAGDPWHLGLGQKGTEEVRGKG